MTTVDILIYDSFMISWLIRLFTYTPAEETTSITSCGCAEEQFYCSTDYLTFRLMSDEIVCAC